MSAEIAEHHLAMLAASAITDEYARARGYETITDKRRLADLKITPAGRNTPGLLVPQLRVDGSTWGYQYRPDVPRLRSGKTVKYETPHEQRNGLDIPPGVAAMLDDPAIPLWITEGVKKGDCGALHGLCIVALSGVWNWLHTNSAGGKMALPDWRDVALNGRRVIIAFDGDQARKPSVQKAAHALGAYLATKGARVEYLWLPDTDDKTGLDDYLAEHTIDHLWKLVKPVQPVPKAADDTGEHRQPEPPKPPAQPVSLTQAHDVFRRWLGSDYDTGALDAMLATIAVERLDGDPLWMLLISGSGNAKTETVQALDGVGAIVTSTVSSPGALLSATARRERAKDATGGLLRRLDPRGVLVIKDVTSMLSMNRDARVEMLAALREVYDGRWSRNVGTDGGKTLDWFGRIAMVGAVTTAWDKAHAVVAAMGDRFVLVRMDTTTGRQAAGRQAIRNTGSEIQMRKELADAVAGVIAGMNTEAIQLTDAEIDVLMAAADIVTLTRTGVEYDYRGDVIDAHAPEMPTRFAKQLTQMVRGAVAVGIDRTDAVQLAIRCARDSMPPIRLAIIDDIAEHPHSSTVEVRKRVDKPRNTVDRQLQAMHILDVLTCDEMEYGENGRTRWFYSLTDGIDTTALDPKSVPEKLSYLSMTLIRESVDDEQAPSHTPSDISGTPSPEPVRTSLSHSDGGPSTNGRDAANAAYIGLCRDCHARPHSAGRPRCDECHRAWLITVDGYKR